MKIYQVGGCVRDSIMGLNPKDIDFVVVGSNENELLSLGYSQVGKDFPVFLHPESGYEYALARTERKTGAGYNGFSVETNNVTLEEDLFRRDLTINAMAMDDKGNIIDPYGGKNDLKNKILKHVSHHFSEDPVRILRIARFSARYNFSIHNDTLEIMALMVKNGEFDSLTNERVWKEFEKVLDEKYLVNYFLSLEKINALEKIPGFNSINEKEFFNVIQEKSDNKFVANLVHTFSQMDKKQLNSWKMPAEFQRKVNLFQEWKNNERLYSYMNIDEKILFIQQHKALHSTDELFSTLENVILYNNWKNNQNSNINNEKNQILIDIDKLKTIDYIQIIEEAKVLKIKPNEAVKKSQILVLSNKKQFKP